MYVDVHISFGTRYIEHVPGTLTSAAFDTCHLIETRRCCRHRAPATTLFVHQHMNVRVYVRAPVAGVELLKGVCTPPATTRCNESER